MSLLYKTSTLLLYLLIFFRRLILLTTALNTFIIARLQDFPPFQPFIILHQSQDSPSCNTITSQSQDTPLATPLHHTALLLSAWIPCGSNSPHFPHSGAPNMDCTKKTLQSNANNFLFCYRIFLKLKTWVVQGRGFLILQFLSKFINKRLRYKSFCWPK